MRRIEPTARFKRDYKREAKGVYRTTLQADLSPVLNTLAHDEPLADRYHDHPLAGDWKDHMVFI